MHETITALSNLVDDTRHRFLKIATDDLRYKPAKEKWSKIEILGHLIDSGINNLQRFTEVPFTPLPYLLRGYDQDQLVITNNYQHADLDELLNLFKSINRRISRVVSNFAPETLVHQIIRGEEQIDLKFLIEDYVSHMRHHLAQIFDANSQN